MIQFLSFNERNSMFKYIKDKIQKWKFMRELKGIKPVVIVVEKTIMVDDVEKPKKKSEKGVKNNAKKHR